MKDMNSKVLGGVLASVLLALLLASYISFGQGSPIPGASVVAVGDNGYGETETGPDGTFVISEGLGTGTYTVTITAEGYISAVIKDVSITAGKETDLGDIVLDPSGVIRGKVVDPNGNPVGGVLVAVETSEGEVLDYVYADDNGNFELKTNIKTGTYKVRASPFTMEVRTETLPMGTTYYVPSGKVIVEGYCIGVKDGVSVTQGEITDGVVVQLPLSGIISGRVTSEDGQPIEGVLVMAFEAGGSPGTSGFFAVTDSNGEYRIANNLETGKYSVTLLYPKGYVWSFQDTVEVDVVAGQETGGVDFSLMKSGKISGVVVYSDDSPAGEVYVMATSTDGKYFGYAITDVDGTFTIDSGLGPGTYMVMAMSGTGYGQPSAQPLQVTLSKGGEVTGLRIVIGPGTPKASIEGTVTDKSGRPLAGATVSAQGISVTTDENGKYKLVVNVRAGTQSVNVVVEASAKGYKSESKTIKVSPGEKVTGVDFALERVPSGILRGRVLSGGAPPAPPTPPPAAEKKRAELTITLSSTEVVLGESIVISGSLNPPREGKVTILMSRDGGKFTVIKRVDLVNGEYSFTFKPKKPGKYTFKARWPGDDEYKPAVSEEVQLIVKSGAAPPAKVTPTITLSLSQTSAKVGDTITVTGTIKPFKGPTDVVIIITGPKGTEEHKVTTSDGSFTYTFTVDAEGTWTVKVRVPPSDKYNQASSAPVSITVTAEKKCIIATVTFGSEVAPEVELLRNFRDNLILSTYTGSRFYVAFDAFYYSWSTPVARFVEEHAYLKPLVKALIYPLLGILLLTSTLTSPLFGVAPEAASIIAGFAASFLIGLVYVAPILVLVRILSKKKDVTRLVKAVTLAVLITLVLILVGYLAKLDALTTLSTSAYVVSTVILGSLVPLRATRRTS